VLCDATTFCYTATTLPDGKYYWRVRSESQYGAFSAWSAGWIINIDTQPPATPVLVGPADGTTTTNPSLTLRWIASKTATFVFRLRCQAACHFPEAARRYFCN